MDRSNAIISDGSEQTNSATPSEHNSETENDSEPESFLPLSSTAANVNGVGHGTHIDYEVLPLVPAPPLPQEAVSVETDPSDEFSLFNSAGTQNTGGSEYLRSLSFTHLCPNCAQIFNLSDRAAGKDLVCGHIMCKTCFRYQGRCPSCIKTEELAASHSQRAQFGGLWEQSFEMSPLSLQHLEGATSYEDHSDQSSDVD